MNYVKTRGFTLIELLMVISIISLLSSIIAASTSVARAKGQDARKITQTKSVQTALALYHDTNGRMPSNYDCTGGSCVAGPRPQGVAYQIKNPTTPEEIESSLAYHESMNDLVEGGFLSAVPESPDGLYGYYDYGQGSSLGGAFTTILQYPDDQPLTYSQCTPVQPAALCTFTPEMCIGVGCPNPPPPGLDYCSFTYPDGESQCNYTRIHQPNYGGGGAITGYSGDCRFSCTQLNGEYCSCNPY